ncbi:MAG: OmpA family protein [Gammaproteobacteria bacterium]|nr:OmpA family protein [Gammaproteobacteria bacterium]
MKKLEFIGFLAVSMTISSCTSVISEEVNYDGTISGNVTFPDMDDATQPEGIFPNLENLAKIDNGVTKKDLYYLIERPHFHEINGAKEWDYIMKFRQPDRSVKICQYKVLFDKDNIARSFFWKPANCLNQKINLNADALFAFDRGGVGDIKYKGKQKLNALVKQMVAEKNKPYLKIVGYTDYLGDDNYNLRLSQQRANSVKQYLVNMGVNASHITADGMGESNPVVSCNKQNRTEQIKCLAPNRRVSINISRH